MTDILNLSGKHILITGGSAGIGRAVAVLCSELGAKVSIIARNEEKLKETLTMLQGEEHKMFPADLSNTSSIEEIIANIVAANGKIDGFVHCAGLGVNLPISMTKSDTFMQVMQVNTFAFMEALRILSKKKYSNDSASFVGASSVASIAGDKTQGAYAASKAAMNAIVHPAAKEFSGRKIRVNTIAFGMIKTDAYYEYIKNGGTDEALGSQYLGYGEPEDAAKAIIFLLSDASKLITGTTLICDGGYLS